MVARVKTWTTSETLASSDLNTEFNNIVNAISSSTADHIDLADVYAWTGAHSWSAATTHTNTLTVGVNDTGHDVKFFGATSGQYMLWDESADELVLAGDSKLSFHDAAGGENIIATSNGHLEVNAGTTLDITAPTVDLNSSTEFNIDTAAYDLNASGAVTIDSAGVSIDSSSASNLTTSGGALTITSAAAATWSTAAGALTLGSGAAINITPASGSAIVLDGTINVDAGVVTGATSITSTAFVGDITGDVTGNADTFTATANNSTNETVYPVFVDGATGTQGAETDTGLTYNPSTGLLSTAAVTTTGVVTAAGFTIGSAVIVEAELETIDGVTAGTVAASKAVVVDSNKDAASFRNITLTGELDAGSLDVSGDADIDGTLEADAITIGSTAIGSIYGVVAGSSSIVTVGTIGTGTWQGTAIAASYVATLNQDTTGTAALATTVTITDNESTNETNAIIFTAGGDVDGGDLGLESDGNLTYNPSSGLLSSTTLTTTGVVTAGGVTLADSAPITMGTGSDATLQFNATNTVLATAGALILQTNGTTEAMRITSAGLVGINETLNANMTIGLTINQAANDDEALALKSSDVTHGVTDVMETDTYFSIRKAIAAYGGASLVGSSESGQQAIVLEAIGGGSTDRTKSTSGLGVAEITASEKVSGEAGQTDVRANGNLLIITSNNTTRFIFDSDGDSHQDVGTAWTNFDDEEDAMVCRSIGIVMDQGSIVKSKFDDWGRDHKEDLIRTGLIQRLSAEEEAAGDRPLMNTTQLARLHNGAIWQIHEKLETMQLQLNEANDKLARLEMN